ncbi:hypothetical protein CLOM_g1264 [Closterium sp. NIES-68]|nr:hypothetical protein CLOM_g1264 [Closterium sp. NIES-68]
MLPHRLRVRDFAAARASEFAALYATLDRPRAQRLIPPAPGGCSQWGTKRDGGEGSAQGDAADGDGAGEARRVVGRREWGARRRRDRVAVRHGTARHLIRRTSSFVRRGSRRTSGAGPGDGRGNSGGPTRAVAGQQRRKRVKVAGLEGRAKEEMGRGEGEWEEEQEEAGEGEGSRRMRRCAEWKRVKQGAEGGRAGNEVGGGGARRLASHVWHAKRFHMAATWGCTLATRVHGRGHGSRAVLEAADRAALVHDASYHSAIQLSGTQSHICTLLARCTPHGALPLSPRPATAAPHTPYAASTSSGVVGESEEARGEAWRNGQLELRAMLCSPASDSPSSTVIGPAAFMWQPVPCVSRASEDGCDAHAPANGGAGSGIKHAGDGGGEVKAGGKGERWRWKQRCRERQGQRKQQQRQQRRVWVWVHALMLRDALEALRAPSAPMGWRQGGQLAEGCDGGQDTRGARSSRRRTGVRVESREGELCRVEVAGRTALPLLLSVLVPAAPGDRPSQLLLHAHSSAATAATTSAAAAVSASPTAASLRLQQSEASWKVLSEHGVFLPSGAVVGFRAVDARHMAGRGTSGRGGGVNACNGRLHGGAHTGSADLSKLPNRRFDWWRHAVSSGDGGSLAAAPSLWDPRGRGGVAGGRGVDEGGGGERERASAEGRVGMSERGEGEEEEERVMEVGGEERVMEGGGEEMEAKGGAVNGAPGFKRSAQAASAGCSAGALPPSVPPPQHLLDACRRAHKLQGLVGASEARRMAERASSAWEEWEGGMGGERQGGGKACEVEGRQGVEHGRHSCDVAVVRHGCGALQAHGVTRWSVILPCSWLQAFWQAFILQGAHAMGLSERHTLFTAAGLPLFPYDYPETFSYRCHVAASYSLQRARYDRSPPSKRPLRFPLPPDWAAACGGRGRMGGDGGDGGIGCAEDAEAGGHRNSDVDLTVARCSGEAVAALLPAVARDGCAGAAGAGAGAEREGVGRRGVGVHCCGTGKGRRGGAAQEGGRGGPWEGRGAGGADSARGRGEGGEGMAGDVEHPNSHAACPPLPPLGLSSSAPLQQQQSRMLLVHVVPAGRGAAVAAAELCLPSPRDFHHFCCRLNGARAHGARSSAWRGVILPHSRLRCRLGAGPGVVVRKTKQQLRRQKQRERWRGVAEQEYVAGVKGREEAQRREGERAVDGRPGHGRVEAGVGEDGRGGARGGAAEREPREVVGFVTSAAPRGSKSRVSLACVRASAMLSASSRQFSAISSLAPPATTSPLPALRVLLLMRRPHSSAYRPVLASLAAEDAGRLATTAWS